MRRVLALSVTLLAVTVLLRLGDRLTTRTEHTRPEAGLDLVLAARGPLLPPRRVGIRSELYEAIVAGDRILVENQDAPPGLRVATLGSRLELVDYRSFDVRSGEDEAEAFRRWIVGAPVPSVCAVTSSGTIAPADERARESLEEARSALGARARPFDETPCSWAFMAVRLRSGWVPLAEVYSVETGVVMPFTIAPDLARYASHRADLLVMEAHGPQTVDLGRELVHAVRRDADVVRGDDTPVGGVPRSGLLFRRGAADGGAIEWRDVYLGSAPVFATYLGIPDGAHGAGSPTVCEVHVNGEVIARKRVDPGTNAWTDWRVDLARFSDSEITLTLQAKPSSGTRPAPVAWAEARLAWDGTGGS